jgi:AAA family ATP:ADP antiporter
MPATDARPVLAGRFFRGTRSSHVNGQQRLSAFERLLSLFTRVQPGEGRCVAILALQAFTLMVAYYLIRPVREALILTQGGAELRSYAVAVQAVLLMLLIPAYGALMRRVESGRAYQIVNAFFACNLLVFFLLGQAGWRLGFAFFVWGSLFSVVAVTQFWAFATDLFSVSAGQRLFGLIAVGVSGGALAGAGLSSALFGLLGPSGLMLASAAALAGVIWFSGRARHGVPVTARSHSLADRPPSGDAGKWLGGFVVIARSRYLVGIAALVVLLNWITSTGDFVLSHWLTDIARHEAPQDQAAYIGRFMGLYCSTVTLVAFLIQLLLVSRIIQLAGLARALLVTPIALVAGYLLVGIVPAFLLLQSVLVVQRSFDYSLLNTTRNALLLPAGREVKYQAKTAIDTFFFRIGDLLSTASVFAATRLFDDARTQMLWLIVALSATMTLIAWLIGREYSRRCASAPDSIPGAGDRGLRPVLVQ